MLLSLLVGVALALHITSSINSTEAVISAANLTVLSGVYFSVFKNRVTDIKSGPVVIDGAWHTVVAPERIDVVQCHVDLFTNNGIVQFNNLRGHGQAKFAAMTDAFVNNGDMYFGISPSQAEPVSIVSKGAFVNNGMIVFRKEAWHDKEVVLGNGTIENNGRICMYNTNTTQRANFVGAGCIHLHELSTFEINLSGGLQFDPRQVLSMEERTVIHVRGLGDLDAGAGATLRNFTVAGFGISQYILVDFRIENVSYDGDTGEVALFTAGGLLLVFTVGQGYKPYKFAMTPDRRIFSYMELVRNDYDCRCERDFPEPYTVPES